MDFIAKTLCERAAPLLFPSLSQSSTKHQDLQSLFAEIIETFRRLSQARLDFKLSSKFMYYNSYNSWILSHLVKWICDTLASLCPAAQRIVHRHIHHHVHYHEVCCWDCRGGSAICLCVHEVHVLFEAVGWDLVLIPRLYHSSPELGSKHSGCLKLHRSHRIATA